MGANVEKLTTRYGSWALVTGSSSGIGSEFARLLAAEGFNLVVAARRQQRLDELAERLTTDYGVEVRPVSVDLTSPNYLDIISEATSDIEIGLTVLNAGSAAPGAFLKQPLDDRTRNIRLNVVAPVELAYHYGQEMSRRGAGAILFVASLVGYTGSPYMASYAASKSYILNFGQALGEELKADNVDVLVLSPGATRTEMTELDDVDMDSLPMPWMEAERVARIGLDSIGKKPAVIAGKRNNLMVFMMTRLMPSRLSSKMFGHMMRGSMEQHLV